MRLDLDPILRRYCEDNSTPPSTALQEIELSTNLNTINPHDATDQIQGRLLSTLSHLMHPKFILEIGTFTAYATCCLIEGLAPNGKIVTIEKEENLKPLINSHLEKAGVADQVEVVFGKALDIISDINEVIDIAFVDATKKEYEDYFNILIEKIRPGGLMIADNTLWKGKVLWDKYDSMTAAIDEFNHRISKDPRVEATILPYRDGLTLIRKK